MNALTISKRLEKCGKGELSKFMKLNIPQFIHDRFLPTMVYIREDAVLHSRLCLFNYFSELFPEGRNGATVFIDFFNEEGNMVGTVEEHIGFQGQLQYDVARIGKSFEGVAAVSMVPDDQIPVHHDRLIGTGYYVCYYDNHGHIDCSHEWEPMAFQKTKSAPWICVVRPHLFPDTQIIVMSNYYGQEGKSVSEWNIRLRDGQGNIITEQRMAPIPMRGSRRIILQEVFPDIVEYARAQRALSVEVNGSNIQGPFTFVKVPSGDFNIHHFC